MKASEKQGISDPPSEVVFLDERHLCPWEAEIWLFLWASQVSYDPSPCSLPQLVASTPPPMAVLQSTITGLQMTLATGRLVCIFFLILLLHDFFSKYTYLFVYLFIYMTCMVVHTCALWRPEKDLSSVTPARLHLLNFPNSIINWDRKFSKVPELWGTSALQTTTAHLRRSEHNSVGSTLSSLSTGPRDWIPTSKPQGGEHLPLLSRHLLRLPYLVFSLLFFGSPPPVS